MFHYNGEPRMNGGPLDARRDAQQQTELCPASLN
jgi:hypothetical protein